MTWKQLEELAERNGFLVGARDFPQFGKALATFQLSAKSPGEETLQYWRKTLPAAKRALCRAVARIREAE